MLNGRKETFLLSAVLICLIKDGLSFSMAGNGHALAMAGQFITFCRNFCSVNEQKVEIFILLLNSVFSARNCCPITNKKLMKCTSRPAIANALVGRIFHFVNRLKFLKVFVS